MRTVTRTLLLVLAVAAADASGADEPQGRMAAARARELRGSGRYGDAEAILVDALKAAPADPDASAELAVLLLETGLLDEAAVAGEAGGSPRGLAVAGEARLSRGMLAEAESLARRAIGAAPSLFRARYLLGEIALERGDRAAAREAFEWFFGAYAEQDVTDPEDLTLTAQASVRAAELNPKVEMDFTVTMKLFDSIVKEHENYLPAWIARGDLYLAVYQDQDAKKSYESALKRNPRCPPALLGLAEQSAFRFDELSGVARCREALLTNPNFFAAKEFIARTRIGDSQYDEAKKLLAEVLAVNPRRKPSLSLLAAIDFLTGDSAGFERRASAILALDATYGRVYAELAALLEQHRRFAEAAVVARKATETDPEDFLGFWILGRNLVHVADEGPAREALTTSRKLDPFAHYSGNAFRENMAEVLGHLEEFAETRSRHFVMKIHVGESAVLSRYYQRFLERSWDALTGKYGHEPEAPILAEVFHIHADFAARTIGLPGIGALGACFGRVITLDSPSARDPGEFGWASTAHHEFAHSMTLSLSRGRVPRWFTEGLSVYEERKFADWWGRDMNRDLFDAHANGEIPAIANFNAEFRGPRVLFAYYLGGMMCEFIEAEFGFPKIRAMLVEYGKDRQTEDVLKDVLGLTPAEYDARFRAWVQTLVAPWRLAPRWSDRTVRAARELLADAPRDLDALVKVAWGAFSRGNTVDAMTYLGKGLAVAPDDLRLALLRAELAFAAKRLDEAKSRYLAFLSAGGDDLFARLHLAQILEQEKDVAGAVLQYEAAKKCFPPYAGAPNPRLEIARIRKAEENLDGAMREIEGFVRLVETDIPHRLELADYYEGRGEDRKLADILTEITWIYPLGEKSALPVHARLGRALARLSDAEGAAMELEVALELGVPEEERPALHVDLGEVYALLGRAKDARRQAEAALELSPDFERAKQLLDTTGGK